MLKLDY